jgi:hypothetical protein
MPTDADLIRRVRTLLHDPAPYYYRTNVTTAAGTSKTFIDSGSPAFDNDFFKTHKSKVRFTSGALANAIGEIISFASNTYTLLEPLPIAIPASSSYQIFQSGSYDDLEIIDSLNRAAFYAYSLVEKENLQEYFKSQSSSVTVSGNTASVALPTDRRGTSLKVNINGVDAVETNRYRINNDTTLDAGYHLVDRTTALIRTSAANSNVTIIFSYVPVPSKLDFSTTVDWLDSLVGAIVEQAAHYARSRRERVHGSNNINSKEISLTKK